MVRPMQSRPQSKERPERFAWGRWILLALVLLLGVPPLIVMACNMGDAELPAVSERCIAVANVPALADRKILGSLKPEGIRLLREMLLRGRPAYNPLTILRTQRKHGHTTILPIDPRTGEFVGAVDADAWAVLLVPVEDAAGQFDTYSYFQDGEVGYLSGPDDSEKILIMPFTPEEFHAQLAPYAGRKSAPPPTRPKTRASSPTE